MAGRRMRAALKRSAFAITRDAGLLARVGDSAWRRRRLLILCYHGVSVSDEHEWNPLLYMTASSFARRLRLIERHGCHVLPLDEALRRLYDGALPDRAVVLTFDDGFHDFLVRAWPILKEHGFPATVYLTTLRCEHNAPVARVMIPYALWKARHAVFDGRDVPGLGERCSLESTESRTRVLARLARGLEAMPLAQKDEMVRRIAFRAGLDYDAMCAGRVLTLLNPSEVAALSAEGVDFELHTHRHRTPSDPDAFANEIRTNRDRILRMTGREPAHFCYPSGVCRACYLPRLREHGVVSAVTCARGFAHGTSDALQLPRVLDSERVSEAEFEAWLIGPAAWLPRRSVAPPH
jgi:peptidoglycan/xylan/chitin deacetylase (PgdA/CDA1 family)